MKTLGSTTLALVLGLSLGACATTSGIPDRALEVTRAGPAEGEISATALRKFEEAVRFFEEGQRLKVVDLDALAARFQEAVEADGRLAEAHYNLGVIAGWQGRHAEAAEHYRRAIARKPSLAVAYENLAVLMENQGNRDAAEEQYKGILRAYPDDAGARARLAELYREGGDPGRAVELAREALLRDPKNLTALKVLMRVHLDRGELPLAKLTALRATKLDEKDPELHHTVGQILEKEGNPEGAVLQYRRALAARPDYLASRIRLAELALEQENWPAAEEALRELLRRVPDDPALHYDLGLALRAQGRIDEALASYARARELAPGEPAPAFAAAVILHKYQDQPEQALEGYRAFVAGHPVNLGAEHPVFGYMRECEALIQAKAEARAAEERARKEAEERARAEKAEAEQKAKLDRLEARDRASAEGQRSQRAAPPGKAPADPTTGAVARDPDEPLDDL